MDALRFFLMRTFPFGSDGNFSNELLIQTINTDLANDPGQPPLPHHRHGAASTSAASCPPAAAAADAPQPCDAKSCGSWPPQLRGRL